MNEYRCIVTWSSHGGLVYNKIYKYRKSALTFANKLRSIFGTDAEITVEWQKREEGIWTMIGRWMY